MAKFDAHLKCSFCGKSQDQVRKLIAGPGVYICDECIDLCNEILDEELIEILYQPSKRKNSKEAFRGFINLFDDYLATDLFDNIEIPIQLIWGEKDPWESLNEAKEWKKRFKNIKRLDIINGAGHCPHDEEPEKTNKLINEFIQETK